MNWFKRSQREPQIADPAEVGYKPEWGEHHGPVEYTPDHWKYGPRGHPDRSGPVPLPKKLYHVTPNPQEIMQEGFKSFKDMSQQTFGGHGPYVSFTSIENAKIYQEALKDMTRLANEEISIYDLPNILQKWKVPKEKWDQLVSNAWSNIRDYFHSSRSEKIDQNTVNDFADIDRTMHDHGSFNKLEEFLLRHPGWTSKSILRMFEVMSSPSEGGFPIFMGTVTTLMERLKGKSVDDIAILEADTPPLQWRSDINIFDEDMSNKYTVNMGEQEWRIWNPQAVPKESIRRVASNWYSRVKTAQIWAVETDETFGSQIHRFYELEYKYSMLRDKPFNGMEKRQENMLGRLETELWDAAEKVRGPIERTINTWLKAHALTDPEQWGEQRSKVSSPYSDWEEYYAEMYSDPEQEGPAGRIYALVEDYTRMYNNNNSWYSGYQQPNWDAAFDKMMRNNSGYEFASIQQLNELLIPDQKEFMFEEVGSEGLEEFNERYNTQFVTEQEAIAFIENASAEDLGIDASSLLDQGIEYWAPLAAANGLLDPIVLEINQKIVFPVWYGYWSAQGIDETREAVETIAKDLKRAKTLPDTVSAVSMALHAVHQGGDMLDYLTDYGELEDSNDAADAKEALNEATSGNNVEQWNKELRAVGVQI